MASLFKELRRRRVFRVAGIYIVAAWLVMQVADVSFPGLNIPEQAIRYVLIAVILGFPLALIFGWMFDITAAGIVRTRPADTGDIAEEYPLRRTDYLILTALGVVAILITYTFVENVMRTAEDQPESVELSEKLPNSIAVLPFENQTGDDANEYFCDGVAEEILNRLSQFRELLVLARQSSFSFKNAAMDNPNLADVLGVRYLLQGSVRKEANKLRINAYLVDESGFTKWNRQFDRELEGIFDIQTEIADAVLRELAPQLAGRPLETNQLTGNIEAYQNYLHARDFFHLRTRRWTDKATELYKKAIQLDPGFAEAYAGLAVAYALTWIDSPDHSGLFANAREYAARAMELKPNMAEGHAAKGLIALAEQPEDYEAAVRHLSRALELNPNHVAARSWLSNAYNVLGRRRDAMRELETALVIDPLNPLLLENIAVSYANMGRYEESRTRFLRLFDLPGQRVAPYLRMIETDSAFGRYDRAFEWIKKDIREFGVQPGGGTWRLERLSNMYASLGVFGKAEKWADIARRIDPQSAAYMAARSEALTMQGRFEEVDDSHLAYLQKSGMRLTDMPRVYALALAGTRTAAGRHESAIEGLEPLLLGEPVLPQGRGGVSFAAHRRQSLAYSYRQVGRENDADRELAKIDAAIREIYEQGFARHPTMLIAWARNFALQNRQREALDMLRQAMVTGYREYYEISHDPLWNNLRANPEFDRLLNIIKSDIDAQRDTVLARETEDPFEAELETELLALIENNKSTAIAE